MSYEPREPVFSQLERLSDTELTERASVIARRAYRSKLTRRRNAEVDPFGFDDIEAIEE